MLLYHASNMRVERPVIINRFTTLDFGTGFYTTTNREQASDFARKLFVRRGRKGVPTVNVYEFERESASAVLEFREFEGPSEEWLNFVVTNRQKGRNPNVSADIIIGPVANDDVFATVALYESGTISADEAITRFKVKKLYDQVLFCNMKALEFLKFIESNELEL